ncbi:MAG: ribosome silencing factor [Bacilli bacterium]|nr:ribosome silencing factor [Bacilli bacterium]
MYPKIVNRIVKAIEDKKGEDIKVYNVKNKTPLFDYVIICSSKNEKNMSAISNSVEEELYKNNFQIKNIEGRDSKDWLILDCYDVIVHIMNSEYRQYVDLDQLLSKKR